MRLCVALLVWLAVAAGVRAQEPDAAALPVHTLRVFTNTIQIPTLVLTESGLPVQEKTHPSFTVSLDEGPSLPVAHARVEGEDPISLAVLMDASGSQAELLHELKWALPLMVGKDLRAHDHVSVYALDCTMVKTLEDAPAEKSTLKVAVESALKSTELHGGETRGACATKLALRDSLAEIARSLKQVPGRRVILVVTDGADTGSAIDWDGAVKAMQHNGTVVFGLALARGSFSGLSGRGTQAPSTRMTAFEPAMDAFCQGSGGLMLTATDMTLTERLRKFTELLRARYIVEFRRSDEMTAGAHPMRIRVVGKTYFIRAAGASMPIADPKLKDDPNVLRLPVAAADQK